MTLPKEEEHSEGEERRCQQHPQQKQAPHFVAIEYTTQKEFF